MKIKNPEEFIKNVLKDIEKGARFTQLNDELFKGVRWYHEDDITQVIKERAGDKLI